MEWKEAHKFDKKSPTISQSHLPEFSETNPADLNEVIVPEHHVMSSPDDKLESNSTDDMNKFAHLFDDTLFCSTNPAENTQYMKHNSVK